MAISNAQRNHEKNDTDTIPNIPVHRYKILDFVINNCFFIELRIDIVSVYYSKLYNFLVFVKILFIMHYVQTIPLDSCYYNCTSRNHFTNNLQ